MLTTLLLSFGCARWAICKRAYIALACTNLLMSKDYPPRRTRELTMRAFVLFVSFVWESFIPLIFTDFLVSRKIHKNTKMARRFARACRLRRVWVLDIRTKEQIRHRGKIYVLMLTTLLLSFGCARWAICKRAYIALACTNLLMSKDYPPRRTREFTMRAFVRFVRSVRDKKGGDIAVVRNLVCHVEPLGRRPVEKRQTKRQKKRQGFVLYFADYKSDIVVKRQKCCLAIIFCVHNRLMACCIICIQA